MIQPTVVISLPISDRRISRDFYQDVLGLHASGPLADDGVPEPLQFELSDGVTLMLIPTGGFGWVIGDHQVAASGHSECLFSLAADTESEVDSLIDRARAADGKIVVEPTQQPWGYTGTFADPDGHLWSSLAVGRTAGR